MNFFSDTLAKTEVTQWDIKYPVPGCFLVSSVDMHDPFQPGGELKGHM